MNVQVNYEWINMVVVLSTKQIILIIKIMVLGVALPPVGLPRPRQYSGQPAL